MANKKSKKSNKCQNEKRRREQENIYIEDLAELISSCSYPTTINRSMKPDKCAILQETVNQIQRIRKQENLNSINSDCHCSPTEEVISPELLGPLFLKALDGFLIFFNDAMIVTYVSNNISNYLPKICQPSVIGKFLDEIIHPNDIKEFKRALENNACDATKKINIHCRFRKSFDSKNFINFQVIINTCKSLNLCSTSNDGYNNPNKICYVCVVRRESPIEEFTKSGRQFSIISTKLSCTGYKILNIENSCYNQKHHTNPNCIDQSILDFCHPCDICVIKRHYQDVFNDENNVSTVYRLKIYKKNYSFVRTESRIFKNSVSQIPQFIISNHTIIRPCSKQRKEKNLFSNSKEFQFENVNQKYMNENASNKNVQCIKLDEYTSTSKPFNQNFQNLTCNVTEKINIPMKTMSDYPTDQLMPNVLSESYSNDYGSNLSKFSSDENDTLNENNECSPNHYLLNDEEIDELNELNLFDKPFLTQKSASFTAVHKPTYISVNSISIDQKLEFNLKVNLDFEIKDDTKQNDLSLTNSMQSENCYFNNEYTHYSEPYQNVNVPSSKSYYDYCEPYHNNEPDGNYCNFRVNDKECFNDMRKRCYKPNISEIQQKSKRCDYDKNYNQCAETTKKYSIDNLNQHTSPLKLINQQDPFTREIDKNVSKLLKNKVSESLKHELQVNGGHFPQHCIYSETEVIKNVNHEYTPNNHYFGNLNFSKTDDYLYDCDPKDYKYSQFSNQTINPNNLSLNTEKIFCDQSYHLPYQEMQSFKPKNDMNELVSYDSFKPEAKHVFNYSQFLPPSLNANLAKSEKLGDEISKN